MQANELSFDVFLAHYLALTFLEFKSFSARSCPVVAVGFSNSFSASFKYCSNFCFSVSYCSHSWTFCCNKIAYFLYNQGLPFQKKTLLFPCCILLLGSSVCNVQDGRQNIVNLLKAIYICPAQKPPKLSGA